MNTLDAIFTRKSVRDFAEKKVSDEDIHTILKAGMSGPSAVNMRPFEFIVVNDAGTIGLMMEANGPAANPLLNADFAIMVCGNLDKAFTPAPGYWVIDASIVCQNMILAAHELGIGSVWLGTYPQQERVMNQIETFALPDNIVPHSIIAFGYPKDGEEFPERDLYDESKVHFNKW